jgi:hypothetical protein
MHEYNWAKLTAEQIENLFLTKELNPDSGLGQAALQALAIKYKRMDVERSRRALWISILALVISLVGIVINAFGAEEGYLCEADMSTGFKLNPATKMWEQANFSVDGVKYVITKSKNPNAVLELRQVGKPNNILAYFSKKGFHPEGGGAVFSSIIGIDIGTFYVNKKTGRYIFYSEATGYVHGDEIDSTPFIEIGKCSPF